MRVNLRALAVAALSSFFVFPFAIARGATYDGPLGNSCKTPDVKVDATKCRGDVSEIKDPCTEYEARFPSTPIPKSNVNLEVSKIFKCGDVLKNCACDLLGQTACDNLYASSDTIDPNGNPLKRPKVKRDRRRTQIIINNDGKAELLLSDEDASFVSESQVWRTNKDNVKINLAENRQLAKLTLAMLYIDIWNSTLSAAERTIQVTSFNKRDPKTPARNFTEYTDIITATDNTNDPRGALAHATVKFKDLDDSQILGYSIAYQKRNFAIALNSCRGQTDPEASLFQMVKTAKGNQQWDPPTDLSCLIRYRDKRDMNTRFKTLKTWPGCSCNGTPDLGDGGDAAGTMVYGACIKTQYTVLDAHDMPIDERIPEAIKDIIISFAQKERFKNWRITEIGLSGCSFPRYETGWNMKFGVEKKGIITADDLSDHASARACDLRSVTFLDEKCKSHTLSLAKKVKESLKSKGIFRKVSAEVTTTPFKDALVKLAKIYGSDFGIKWPFGKNNNGDDCLFEANGIGKFWAQIEKLASSLTPPKCPKNATHCTPGKDIFTEDEWFQISAGSGFRTSAVSSGLVTYDLLLNKEHDDHFHLAVPEPDIIKNDPIWDKFRSNAHPLTDLEKEAYYEDYHRAAAGIASGELGLCSTQQTKKENK